jgi:N-acetylglucosaminyldiphosphoundecaprenol N-acetyl-beta-D-mannosaminyltransferase
MTEKPEPIPRVDVIGSSISICDSQKALALIEQQISGGRGGYVCFTNVHAAVMGYRDDSFREITNNSFLSVADGKPVYWAGRISGAPGLGHIPGPDFMFQALEKFPGHGHFFYGSTPSVLAALAESIRQESPDIKISGSYSPPFRPLDSAERKAIVEEIRDSGATFVWVGLGAPKQERWMHEMYPSLQPAVLLGVGAAFDFGAGSLKRAPVLFRKLGLEWLYRLSQEPARLWKRYASTNLLFIYCLIRQKLRRR